MPIAYLVSRYPAVSHAFIQTELGALRERGVSVRTASVRRAEEADLASPADRAAAQDTHWLLPTRWTRVLAAHGLALLTRPGAYLGTLRFALARGSLGLRSRVFQLFYFAEAILLWRWCRREGVRHVHVHFANPAADVALLLVRFAGGRGEGWSWSLTMHGPTEFHDLVVHRVAEKVRRAAWVQCISEYARSQVMALLPPEGWDKLEVVHCGVDASRYDPARWPRRASARLRLLNVARLVPNKAHPLLLRAVAALLESGVECELAIVGDGPERERLVAEARALGISDRLRLPGSVGQDQLPGHYAEADLFCLPSFAEGLPVVLMEAMAMELPVVAPRLAGIPELVEDGVSGRLVVPGSLEALVAALRGLAHDPEERARMGAAGRRKVIAEFDPRASAARIERVLRERLPAAALT
jgi:glycosyltransferase involved in cell wall biosynthesis